MKITSITLAALIFSTAFLMPLQANDNAPLPLNYPADTISTNQPYIIWQDLYTKRDLGKRIRYRITVKSGDKKYDPVLCYPYIYYKNICAFRYPFKIPDGKYSYKIERLIDKKPIESQHFHYLKYPIKNSFLIDTSEKNDIDDLPPGYLIKYLYIERHNRYINKYNSIFFGTGGLTTLGIGILFFSVLDFGMISTIVSALCFTSSAVGFTASGYYGYQYIKKNNELHKIINLGKNISVKGGADKGNINADVELSF